VRSIRQKENSAGELLLRCLVKATALRVIKFFFSLIRSAFTPLAPRSLASSHQSMFSRTLIRTSSIVARGGSRSGSSSAARGKIFSSKHIFAADAAQQQRTFATRTKQQEEEEEVEEEIEEGAEAATAAEVEAAVRKQKQKSSEKWLEEETEEPRAEGAFGAKDNLLPLELLMTQVPDHN
jgi:hypothetical protein